MKRKWRYNRTTSLLFAAGTLFAATSAAHAASPWVDFAGEWGNLPVRLDGGNVQCASYDGSNCAWGSTAQQATQQAASLQPLSCGAVHAAKYQATGYDTSQHWCSVAYGRYFAQWKPSNAAQGIPAYSVDPDGDIQCYSTDGSSCDWNTRDPGATATVSAMPLACGKMHESLYGTTGYATSTHWCAKAKQLETQYQGNKFNPTVLYGSGASVVAYGRSFTLCPNRASKGDWPSPGGSCALGNMWQDNGWVPGSPANIGSWVAGKPHAAGDAVVYNGNVYATVTEQEAGSPESNTAPNVALYYQYRWSKIGKVQ